MNSTPHSQPPRGFSRAIISAIVTRKFKNAQTDFQNVNQSIVFTGLLDREAQEVARDEGTVDKPVFEGSHVVGTVSHGTPYPCGGSPHHRSKPIRDRRKRVVIVLELPPLSEDAFPDLLR
ncbi:hypothetical protein FGIG_04348 [Fasciola gigantica]|uniref:Uncharacterized protein n=1 Tax=Fasciola gigantica TaxID=46835 RepID=A0A504YLL0_FASGI|nr:hypothetical protein FGIG_04348 [Fasciola gigantica]